MEPQLQEWKNDFIPHPVKVDSFGHKRNRSADLRPLSDNEAKKEGENLLRKLSEGAPPAVGGQSQVGFYQPKKKLSVTRNVNLPLSYVEQDLTTEVTFSKTHSPMISESPLGLTLSRNGITQMDSSELNQKKKELLTIRIYISRLLDEDEQETDENVSGVQFDIEGGRLADAERLLQLMSEQCKISPEIGTEVFALWMVSPLLEIQLKPHHRPYEVRCGWLALLNRFVADRDRKEFAADEPILFFRRNVHLSTSRELQIVASHPECGELLLLDARAALLADRLSMKPADAAYIAGLTFALDNGPFNDRHHSIEFIRKNIANHLPSSQSTEIRGSLMFGKAISGITSNEQILLKTWKDCTKNSFSAEMLVSRILQMFADVSPCYGSAYFYGTIERPSLPSLKDVKKFLQAVASGNSDVEVRVGINEEYISVFDMERCELLLLQKIEECTWRRVDGCGENAGDSQFLLNFPETGEGASKNSNGTQRPAKTYLLQVFGKQAALMEALLNAQIRTRSSDDDIRPEDAADEMQSDSSLSSSPPRSSDISVISGASSTRKSTASRTSSFSKSNKLCLACFVNGTCVDARGNLKKVFLPTPNISIPQPAH